jgi:hypothetical protein
MMLNMPRAQAIHAAAVCRGISSALRGLDAALPGGDLPILDAMASDESMIPRLMLAVRAAGEERAAMAKRGM